MSDPGTDDRRHIWVNGKRYKATPQGIAALQNSGQEFSYRPPNTPEQQGAEGGEGMWSSILETLGDTSRGAAHGATLGFADYKFGDDNQSVMQRVGLDDYNDVQKRSPYATTAGDLGAGLAMGGLVGGGKSLLGVMGREAALGAVEGGARTIAEGGTAGEAATAAATGGALGGALPGVGQAVAGGVKKAGNAISNAVGSSADSLRNRSVGIGAKEARELGDINGGVWDSAGTAKLIEEVTPSKGIIDMSPLERANDLKAQSALHGPAIDQFLDAKDASDGINNMIPTFWTDAQQKLKSWADGMPGTGNKELSRKNAALSQAERFAAEQPPTASRGLRERKTALQQDGREGNMGFVPETPGSQVDAHHGELLKDALQHVVDHGTPGTKDEFNKLNQRFAKIAKLRDVAYDRGNVDQVNTQVPGMVTALLGGGIGSQMTEEDPLKGFLGGVVAGGLSATNPVTTRLLSTPRAMGTQANILRKAQGATKDIDLSRMQSAMSHGGVPAGMGASEYFDEEGEEEARRQALGYGSHR